MSRLATSYTITWASGTYTITYASVYSSVAFGDDAYVAYVMPNSTVYINVGQADELVTLDWQKNTNLSASSASDLIVKIAALTSASATYTTLTTSTLYVDTALYSSADSSLIIGTPACVITNSGLRTDSINAVTTNENLRLTGNGSGIVEIGDNLLIESTTNQIVLGVTRTATISAPTPATASRTYTLPDLSADYSIVGTEGAQTINGAKTLTSGLICDSLTSRTTNGHLDLTGNGTGVVRVTDTLAVDTIAAYTVNGNTTVNGNGTGCLFAGTNGLKFVNATSSYVPSALQYYETFQDLSFWFTGPFTGTVTTPLNGVRIGGYVLFSLASITSGGVAAAVATSSSTILTRFRPSIQYSSNGIVALDNSVNVAGRLVVNTNGTLVIGLGPTGAVYTAAGNAGWSAFNYFYVI
mgnify:CR=1 FL=1